MKFIKNILFDVCPWSFLLEVPNKLKKLAIEIQSHHKLSCCLAMGLILCCWYQGSSPCSQWKLQFWLWQYPADLSSYLCLWRQHLQDWSTWHHLTKWHLKHVAQLEALPKLPLQHYPCCRASLVVWVPYAYQHGLWPHYEFRSWLFELQYQPFIWGLNIELPDHVSSRMSPQKKCLWISSSAPWDGKAFGQ